MNTYSQMHGQHASMPIARPIKAVCAGTWKELMLLLPKSAGEVAWLDVRLLVFFQAFC
jgi:hypothetical protein